MCKVDDAISVKPYLPLANWQYRGNSYLHSMKQHHTKTKGDLGVLKAQAALCAKGFLVCLPLSEHAPFDLVIYKNGKFQRVQVKTRSISQSGSLSVRFEHFHSDSKGLHSKKVDFGEIDLYCIYCLDNDQCYYFNPKTINPSITLSLRVNSPKNNQKQGVHFAEDYLEVP